MDSNPIIHFILQILTLRGSFDWNTVWNYFFSIDILQGIIITLLLSIFAQMVGSLIGLLLYFMRRSRSVPLQSLANAYIWFFRGTPVLVQILFLFQIFPYLHLTSLDSIHVFAGLGFVVPPLLSAFLPVLIALALNEGAYMAEIVRAGIDSVDTGQLEAAKSLGMTYGLAMRRIVLPQALRVIVPPLGNEFNSMLKTSSLASVIGVTDLLGAANGDHAALGRPLEFLVIASIYYLLLTTAWGLVQAWIERKLNASNIDPGSRDTKSWWKRVFGFGGTTVGATSGEVAIPVPLDHR